MSDTTSKYAIEQPEADGSDFINEWPTIMRSALAFLDANIATAITTNPRPAASKFGRIHRTAAGVISFDTGSTWVTLSQEPHASKHAAGGSDALTITTAMFAAGAVDAAAIATDAVGSAEIAAAGVGTSELADASVTPAKLDSTVVLAPVGFIGAYAGATDPSGGKWLICDGRALSRATYATLFAALASTYGSGDGSTTFNIPDLRGRVPVGVDGTAGRLSANDARGNSGGEEQHTLSDAEMPSHLHSAGTYATDTEAAHTHGDGTLATNAVQPWTTGWNAPISDTSWAEMTVTPWPGTGLQNPDVPYAGGAGVNDANLSYTSGSHSHDVTGSTASAGSHDHDVTGASGNAGSDSPHNNMQPYLVVNHIIRAL